MVFRGIGGIAGATGVASPVAPNPYSYIRANPPPTQARTLGLDHGEGLFRNVGGPIAPSRFQPPLQSADERPSIPARITGHPSAIANILPQESTAARDAYLENVARGYKKGGRVKHHEPSEHAPILAKHIHATIKEKLEQHLPPELVDKAMAIAPQAMALIKKQIESGAFGPGGSFGMGRNPDAPGLAMLPGGPGVGPPMGSAPIPAPHPNGNAPPFISPGPPIGDVPPQEMFQGGPIYRS